MKYSPSPDLASLSPDQAIDINRVCDSFEQALRAGRQPSLEHALAAVDESLRAALLRDLLAIELEYRRSIGERAEATEYRRRFPEHAPTVEAAFARLRETQRAPGAPDREVALSEAETLGPRRIAPARAARAMSASPRDLFDHPDYEIVRELAR